MDRLAEMEVFARVAESGSFSEAARQLGLSKSVVSKHVRALEDRLGVRLINRTTRRLSLTEVGRAYVEGVSRIIAQVEEAELSARSLHGEPRGRLRVNGPMSFGHLHLAPLIPAFLARYPDIKVDLTLNDRLVDVIDEGYDVAVRIASLADSSLIARRLAPARSVLCASPAYLEAHGEPRLPADLRDHDCLRYTYLATPCEWRFAGPGGEQIVRVAGSLLTNSGDALRAAALEGLGVARLPTFIVGADIRAGRLERLLPEHEALPTSAIHAVYPHNRHLSAKLRAFVDFLAERFGPSPPWDRGC